MGRQDVPRRRSPERIPPGSSRQLREIAEQLRALAAPAMLGVLAEMANRIDYIAGDPDVEAAEQLPGIMTIKELADKFAAKRPERQSGTPRRVLTEISNDLGHLGVSTLDELRERMHAEGRPQYWFKGTGIGGEKLRVLNELVDDFDLVPPERQ